jgi:tetratricopeptide (TPR) repeat protein
LEKREDLCVAARSEVFFIGGLACDELEDYERAIADYGRAIELNPNGEAAAAAYDSTSCGYALMGDDRKACEWLQAAIALDESCREKAREDGDFDSVRESVCFQALLTGD